MQHTERSLLDGSRLSHHERVKLFCVVEVLYLLGGKLRDLAAEQLISDHERLVRHIRNTTRRLEQVEEPVEQLLVVVFEPVNEVIVGILALRKLAKGVE